MFLQNYFNHSSRKCDTLESVKREVNEMQWLIKNIVVLFWAFLLGEVLGYIGGQLQGATADPTQMGIVAMVTAFIAVNAITAISKKAN